MALTTGQGVPGWRQRTRDSRAPLGVLLSKGIILTLVSFWILPYTSSKPSLETGKQVAWSPVLYSHPLYQGALMDLWTELSPAPNVLRLRVDALRLKSGHDPRRTSHQLRKVLVTPVRIFLVGLG